MDDIVIAAMAKWPHVPEVFGWLRLDGRGMWWLKHQRLNHVGMLDFIQRNYSQDAQGRPFFQNGPQRVFVDFDRAPYVARHTPQGVVLHPGEAVDSVTAAYLTPDGELWLSLSASRLAAVDDRDLAALAERAPRPALMIIGEVVALRDELRWFSEGLIETAVKAA